MHFSVIFLTILMFTISRVMALDVSPDGPRLVELPEDASSVIIGNPAHATVALDNPRLMIITAGIPGMTKLTVLGKSGRVIFNERLTVNAGGGDYIRIKNACINGGDTCQPTKMFHCGDGKVCNNVIVNEPTAANIGGNATGDPAAMADEGGEE